MSGPKGYSVRVESPEERARRELAEARTRCRNLVARLQAANDVLRQESAQLVSTPAGSTESAEVATRFEAELLTAIEAANKLVRRAKIQAVVHSMPTSITSQVGVELEQIFKKQAGKSTTVLQQSQPEVREPSPTSSSSESHSDTERVAKMVAAVAELDDSSMRKTLLAQIQSAGSSRSELDVIGVQINHEYRIQQEVRMIAEEAEETVLSLDSSDRASALLIQRSKSIRTREQLRQLVNDVAALKRKNEADADDAYVTNAAQEALVEMGYSVELLPTPPNSLSREILARRNDLPDHALQVRLLPDSKMMLTRVVSTGDTTETQDLRAEQATCTDSAGLAQRLERSGIRSQRVHAQHVGAVPVARISGMPLERRDLDRASEEHQRSSKTRSSSTRRRNERSVGGSL